MLPPDEEENEAAPSGAREGVAPESDRRPDRGLARELEEHRERAVERANAAEALREELAELRREIAALRERATGWTAGAEAPDDDAAAQSEDLDPPEDLAPTRRLLRRWRVRG